MQNKDQIQALAESLSVSKAKLVELITEDTEMSIRHKLMLLEEHSGWEVERYLPRELYKDLNAALKELGPECGYGGLSVDRFPEDRHVSVMWTEDTEDVEYDPEVHDSDLMEIAWVGAFWQPDFIIWMERSAYMQMIFDYAIKNQCIGYTMDW